MTPVTVAVALVAGAVIVTLAGDTVALVVSPLVRLMVSGDVGAAGTDTVTVAVPPRGTVVFETVIGGVTSTVTGAVVLAMEVFGTLAVIVTGPPAFTPVTCTATVFEPAGMVTEVGTEAVVGSLDERVTGRPPVGALPDRVSVNDSTLLTYTVEAPDRTIVPVTVTVPEPDL